YLRSSLRLTYPQWASQMVGITNPCGNKKYVSSLSADICRNTSIIGKDMPHLSVQKERSSLTYRQLRDRNVVTSTEQDQQSHRRDIVV
ncbi:MAG: hypothetical protein KBT27_02455, partial [Prevotellaceae bacterium]|nr:hypothetical protein [Candidatus Faecinaster equi]